MAVDTTHVTDEIELVGMDGTVLTTIPFEVLGPLSAFSGLGLTNALEQGRVNGVPAARTDHNDVFMERYALVCGDRRIQPLDYVLDYFPTQNDVRVNRRMTLVKVPLDEAARWRT